MNKEVKVWRYVIRSCQKGELEDQDTGQWWGVFLIDSTGLFTAVTDAGNYAYYWGNNSGEDDFRDFIVRNRPVESSYLLEKFCGSEKEYDEEETFKRAKLEIFRLRRSKSITPEQARHFLRELKVYNNLCNEYDFYEWYHCSDGGSKIDPSEVFRRKYPEQAKYFLSKIFTRLQKVIKEELANERLERVGL